VTALPGRWRLVPAAVAAWLAAALGVGAPHLALAAAGVALLVAAACVVVAARVRVLVVAALAATAAAGVLGAIGLAAPGREPPALAEAAASGRSLDLEVLVTGRAVQGRFDGVVVGTRAPVLVFGPRDAAPPIGATVALRADLEPAQPGEDVAFLAFARDGVEELAAPVGLLAWAHGIRAAFLAVSEGLPDPGGSLLPGLAIGETSRVSADLDAAMKTSSLSHLTAVSGANCAIVVGAALAVCALLGAPLPVRLGAAAVALLGFVVLVTPEPSVQRAAVMAGLALGAVALGRPALGVPLLCTAVVLLLLADPWLARSYGFVLSVLATGGLLLLAGPLGRALARVLPDGLATLLSIPLAAQLACQPVILLLDPSLALYGVPANLLAAPAAPVATIVGLLACILGVFAPPLGGLLAWLGWLPAAWIAAVAELFAGMPGARGAWPAGPGGVALLAAVEVAALVAVLGAGRPRRIARGVAFIALVAYTATAIGGPVVTRLGRPPDWQFAQCDVGQGDAVVVRSGEAIALVDAGPDPPALAACLADLGVARVDLLVLTHFDLDHVGGVDAVAGRVDRVLAGPPGDAADERMLATLAAAGARIHAAARGQRGRLGDLDWEVLWPPATGATPGNDASVALRWSCASGCLEAVMLGDLGEEAQRRMAGSAVLSGVDVVKVAHHGSADQSAELYGALRAAVGLIGVGADNDYGHPTERLLGIIAAAGTTALRSDEDGLVLVGRSADGGIAVWTQR